MKFFYFGKTRKVQRSAPTRGPWIEITLFLLPAAQIASAPTRGPWIEICCKERMLFNPEVGPHTGAVD